MHKIKKFLFHNTNQKQTIAKNTIWLFVGEIIGRIFKLIIVVFATRKLGVEGWGVFSYGLAFVSFFYILGDFGINTFLTRELSKDANNKTKYLGTSVILKISLLLIFFLASISIGTHIGKINLGIHTIIVFSTFFIFESLREFALAINRSSEKLEREGFSKILINVSITVLGVILILKDNTPLALALAYMIGSIIATVHIFWSIRHEFRNIPWNFSKEHFKTIYVFSWPLIIIGLFSFLFSLDSIMLGQLKSATEVGLYAASQRLVQFLLIIPAFIATATFPLLSKHEADTAKLTALFEKIMIVIIGVALPLTIGGLFFGKHIVLLILGQAYSSAIPVFAILLLTTLASFPNMLLTNLIFSKNLQRLFIVASSFGVVVNIGLNLWLIPLYGAIGAAISTTVSSLIIMSINWFQMKKFVPFHVASKLKNISIATLTMAICIVLLSASSLHFLLSIVLATIVYVCMLYILKEPLLLQILVIIRGTE